MAEVLARSDEIPTSPFPPPKMKTSRRLILFAVLLAAGLVAVFSVHRRPPAARPAPPTPVARLDAPAPEGTAPAAAPAKAPPVSRRQRAARIIRVADAIPSRPGAQHVPTKAEEPVPGAPPPLPIAPDFLEKMVDQTGKLASFELPGGISARGTVDFVKRDEAGNLSLVQGRLSVPSAGFFFFGRPAEAGVAGAFSGLVRFDQAALAYRAEPIGPENASMLVPRRLDQVICLGMPAVDRGLTQNAPQTYPTNVPIPAYNNNIVSLQSLPGARAVVYLDFNGGPGPWVGWGSFVALPSGSSNAQIREVWQRVAEDYQGFNINITTDLKIYNNATPTNRQHVMITPTNDAAPGAGGIAYLGSFNTGAEQVCWAFYTDGKNSAEVVAHEVGHTVGLSHMGQNINGTHNEYYEGQGTGDVSWAPIMGAGYYNNITVFSKGDYANPSNTEDQLRIITSNNNNVAYRADDDGATFATAKYLEIFSDNSVASEGILETVGDVDAYRFTVTATGTVSLTVNPVNAGPNLDLVASIYKSDDISLVFTNNPATKLPATVTAVNLAPGDYTLRVTATGYGSPITTGYSNYGIIGAYLITGTVPNGVTPVRLSVAENAANAAAVGSVTARNAHGANPLTYAIASGNASGAFAINASTGAITVADRTKLDYETLFTRWDVPVAFPLFVTITDSTSPGLNETIRVLVSVTNVNEAPTVTGGAGLMISRTAIGTSIVQAGGSDPDVYDFPTFSITSGNTGGAFAIDPGTGQITVAALVDVPASTVYTLNVRVTDQGTPALTADATVSITVAPLPAGYTPGTIADTYYENINGTALVDLTGNANFPYNPTSEVYLTSANDANHGDSYGSVMRGFVLPPITGTYTFWIASDDVGELRISPDANPANAVVRASNPTYTDPNVYTKFASQKSIALTLTAGQPYYIEARQKEGNGGDNLSIAWQPPGLTRQVIPGRFMAPFYLNHVPAIPATTLPVRRDAYVNSLAGIVPVTDFNAQDGHNAFAITGGTGAGLFSIDAATGIVRVKTSLAAVATGATYTLNVTTADTGTPALTAAGTITMQVIEPAVITYTTIAQQFWTNMFGSALTDLTGDPRYPYQPTTIRALTTFESPAGLGDRYGDRIRVLLTPPATGAYQFYISSDDNSALLLNSTGPGAAGAAQIASVAGYTNPGVYNTQASQTSAVFNLTAGQSYYLETLHKQGNGGDFLQVAWTGPNIAAPTIIPGTVLKPYNLNVAPVYNAGSYAFSLRPNSPAGTPVGNVAATDPEGSAVTFAILGGNASGAFAINPATGAITTASGAAATPGTASALTIGVQDDGIGGAYPLASSPVTVTINVPKLVDQWRRDKFGADAGTPAIAGDLADPDLDGLSNLVEYALATNPVAGNASGLVADQETVGGNVYLRLTIPKGTGATDVTYSVEVTGDVSDPASWSGAATVVEVNSASTLQVRDSVAMSAATRRFIRLRVSVP